MVELTKQNWDEFTNGDPLPWLLETANPSVRYWTLKDILRRTNDDPEVEQSRAAIAQQPLVLELFTRQHPQGHWGEDASKPYTAQGAVGVLSLLYMLGVAPDQRTKAGCDSLLANCQHESGGFSLIRKVRSGIFPCTTGEHLPFLVYFGLADDPRVRTAFSFLIKELTKEAALTCGRYQHQKCLWGAIAGLNGLAVLPAEMRSEQSERVVKRLANELLGAQYDFESEHKRWLTFGVPRAWDLLSALKALAAHGYASDRRFLPLFQMVLNRQNDSGQWLCGSVSRTWSIEKRNQPSKWVTLDVLRVLRSLAPVK